MPFLVSNKWLFVDASYIFTWQHPWSRRKEHATRFSTLSWVSSLATDEQRGAEVGIHSFWIISVQNHNVFHRGNVICSVKLTKGESLISLPQETWCYGKAWVWFSLSPRSWLDHVFDPPLLPITCSGCQVPPRRNIKLTQGGNSRILAGNTNEWGEQVYYSSDQWDPWWFIQLWAKCGHVEIFTCNAGSFKLFFNERRNLDFYYGQNLQIVEYRVEAKQNSVPTSSSPWGVICEFCFRPIYSATQMGSYPIRFEDVCLFVCCGFFCILGLHMQHIPTLYHNHSHAKSKLCLWPTPQLTATPDP